MKAKSSPFLSRRTSCTGVGMACPPRDSKHYHSQLTHHQWNVNMAAKNKSLQIPHSMVRHVHVQ